ncbi:hypothetical protein [Pontixanthobacter aquaemixtae]|uniref:Uncharacterized protein n=1 Tax=Pontixanthobacter aquaemixtae TaxID=1958940 RepID=A0A844ZRK6_9SPHN|nr:hypothetical protein [Pontixanthobacter aquaemixtae]MXO90485.1 hypothetical protein [Pontixanthobacter aquaemixtae]
MEVLLFLPVFLIGFGAIWLGVTALLGALSGWSSIESRYPDNSRDRTLETLRFQSGSIGYLWMGGVQYRGCLRLDICQTGLRVSVSRFLGPFSRPFFVPWGDIRTEKVQLLFVPAIRLCLGLPEAGRLAVTHRCARKIASASEGRFKLPQES